MELISSAASPTGVSIAQSDTRLNALSKCCADQIHYTLSGWWYCSGCKLDIKHDPRAQLASYWSLSSGGPVTNRGFSVEQWISYWTGYAEADISVDVRY